MGKVIKLFFDSLDEALETSKSIIMNKIVCLFALLALFAVASAQYWVSNHGYGAWPASYAHVPAAYHSAPLTTGWNGHYAAAPVAWNYAWKK